jgi:hypothetical protein
MSRLAVDPAIAVRVVGPASANALMAGTVGSNSRASGSARLRARWRAVTKLVRATGPSPIAGNRQRAVPAASRMRLGGRPCGTGAATSAFNSGAYVLLQIESLPGGLEGVNEGG